MCPGHPLLDAIIDLTLERHRDLLKRGAVLVDERDEGDKPRVLLFLEHAIQDASLTSSGDRRIVSKRMLYVELDADGMTRHVHYAPYLDYRPLAEDDPGLEEILERPQCAWIDRDIEMKTQGYAVANVVPEHLAEVRDTKLALIAKTEVAVKDALQRRSPTGIIAPSNSNCRSRRARPERGSIQGRPASARTCCKHVSRNGLRNSGLRSKSRRCPRWCWEECWSSPRGLSMQ